MSHEVIVYGSRALAAMLYEDSLRHPDFTIVAFVVDESYLDPSGYYLGLPQVGLQSVSDLYPRATYDMMILISTYEDMRIRDSMYHSSISLGYPLRNYVSPSSIVSSHVSMGHNNVIFEQVYMGPQGRMGSFNIIRQHVYIGHDFTIGDRNVIAPGCKIGGHAHIAHHCYIGIGATLIDHISIAEESLVGAGSVVIKDTEPYSRNVGNPSRVISYKQQEGLKVNR